MQEFSKFHLQHYCKTKISRGSGHYLGTFWPNTGIAKWIKDAESIRSGITRHQSTSVISTSFNYWRNAEPQRRAAKHLGHTWYVWKRFLNPGASSSALIRRNWIHGVPVPKSRSIHPQWRKVNEKNTIKIWDASPDSQPKIQFSSVEETLQRIMEQTNDCRFRIFIFTIYSHQPRLFAGREDSRLRYVLVHNFLRKLRNGSKKWRWLIQWMIWCLRQKTRGIQMPKLQVLDARIASALNKIIHNSHFKRKISLEEQKAQKQGRFLCGTQIAYLIYDHFRVTGGNDSVENFTDLFTIVVRNDEIQEFDSKWDGILLSLTKIPHDDILEDWGKNSWKRLSLIGDETVINFKAQKSMYSQILCYVSAKFFNIPNPTKLGRTELQESDPRKATETLMLSMESRLNSSGTSSQDSLRCSSVVKSMMYWATWNKHQKLSEEAFYSCRCSTTFLVSTKAMKKFGKC